MALSFTQRLTTIDKATDRAATEDVSPYDATFIIEHLAFNAFLLLHDGRFASSETKTKLSKALKRVEKLAETLRREIA